MHYANFDFTISCRDRSTRARCGVLDTPHGRIDTPNIIFCATSGVFKNVLMDQVRQAGADIILANTYHLLIQPGPELIRKHGGIHKMVGWDGPMLTDSGGFQIFSLAYGGVSDEIKRRGRVLEKKNLVKITDEGALFRSHRDGRLVLLTPELSMQVQRDIGADLVVVLDECTAINTSKEYTAQAMRRSHAWAERSLAEFAGSHDGTQALYGIVQGGVYQDLRRESADFINGTPFFGQAIGGSLGRSRSEMLAIVEEVTGMILPSRPTHLLGIGGIQDVWNGVAMGIDTFDCVHPTRLARHGGALVDPETPGAREHINLRNARYRDDLRPLAEDCDCYCCRRFTRAYLQHLIRANESVFRILLSIHNIRHMVRTMERVRQAIREGCFAERAAPWLLT